MKTKQLTLNIYKGSKGGRRPGSGRKRIHSKGIAHRIREKVNHRTPLHINFKFKAYIRNKYCLKLLKRAILNAQSHGLWVVHFSLQSNHVHLIVEAESNVLLTKAMRSLTVTFAKGLRKGKVQVERYHLHVLKSIKETQNAIHYVLFNKQKHEKGRYSKIDEFSSLLNVDRAVDLIRCFAIKNKITLIIGDKDEFPLDRGKSFLLKKSFSLFCTRPETLS